MFWSTGEVSGEFGIQGGGSIATSSIGSCLWKFGRGLMCWICWRGDGLAGDGVGD